MARVKAEAQVLAGVKEGLQLSEAALEHLSEVMAGDLNRPDPKSPCIYCDEIRAELKRVLATLNPDEGKG